MSAPGTWMTRLANRCPANAACSGELPLSRLAKYAALNESPAAVVSTTFSTFTAGTAKRSPPSGSDSHLPHA